MLNGEVMEHCIVSEYPAMTEKIRCRLRNDYRAKPVHNFTTTQFYNYIP